MWDEKECIFGVIFCNFGTDHFSAKVRQLLPFTTPEFRVRVLERSVPPGQIERREVEVFNVSFPVSLNE